MACFTRVEVLEDTVFTAKARKKLGYPVEGDLLPTGAAVEKARKKLGLSKWASATQVRNEAVRSVKKEAGILKTMAATKRLYPSAVVRRNGDKLQVSVNL